MNEKSVSAAEEPCIGTRRIRFRTCVKIVAIGYSAICMMLFMIAGMFGLIMWPLFAARYMPDAPIAWPVQWIQGLAGGDPGAFKLYYALLSSALFLLVMLGCGPYFRMCGTPRRRKLSSKKVEIESRQMD